MVTIANPKELNSADYMGKSTDPKPTDAAPNSIFWEWNTNKFFVFDADSENWVEIGGDA